MFGNKGLEDWRIITVPQAVGERGQTRLTLLDAPLRYSPSRNAVMVVDVPNDDFHLMVIDEVMSQAYCKRKQGFLRSTLHCRRCGAQLDVSQPQRATHELDVRCEGVNPFHIKLEAPSVKCPACALSNAVEVKGTEDELVEATLNLLLALDKFRP